MYFVLQQLKQYNVVFDHNVRTGGFRTQKGAFNAAKKHAPAIVKNEHRVIVAQTVNPTLPGWVQ